MLGRRMATTVIHEPRLDTILMVERAILQARSYPTKKELWQSLPKQIQYQTFNRILQYLESSNKILIDDGGIVWTFADNAKLKTLLRSSTGLRDGRVNISPKIKKVVSESGVVSPAFKGKALTVTF